MASLNERLKKAREEAGLTLKRMAELCQIQVKYIERLENGQYDKLPAPVYTQGFLKKCAQILNLQPEEILDEYKKELGTTKTAKQKRLLELPSLKSPRLIITPKILSWLAAGIIILAIAGYLIYQLDFLIAPPRLSLDYPSQDLTFTQTSIEVLGQSDPTAKLTINGTQVYIDKDGKFRQVINLSPGQNTLIIEAVNRFGKKSEITKQIIVKQ